ncbi:hypothetical protein M9458_017042, partial [Cirrhinus mrigala]
MGWTLPWGTTHILRGSPEYRMSIAASEGEPDLSGEDDPAVLPPSGRSAILDADPGMMAMLAQAAERIGLEWKSPLRKRSSGLSSLTTLDGGAVRVYTEVPPVERLIATQMCPSTASTWQGKLLLPSRAHRHSSGLIGSAYATCGEAGSALHAMALVQVHQTKALKDLHEGGHTPEVLRELALRVTKVTAWSLGCAMSTTVVQECHLWLCLVDMRETDKTRFLNSPASQTSLFGDAVENFAQQFSATQKQTEAIKHVLPRCAAAASTRPPVAAPQHARRQGWPPASAPAPPPHPQQPSSMRRGGARGRQAAPPILAPVKPGGKRNSK